MTPRIVVLDGATHGLVDRLRAVRAAGDIPLVDDVRRPEAEREAVRALVRDARPTADAAWATLTSGSSGTPRIVLRTAASWAESFAAVSALLYDPAVPDAERVVALPAPPSSSLTLFSLAHALGGGPRPVFPGQDAGVDGGFAEATSFHGTPQALRALLDGGGLPRVRTALVGGSHLDQDLRADAESEGIRVVSYYGAAELSFVARRRRLRPATLPRRGHRRARRRAVGAVPVRGPRVPRRRRTAADRRGLGDGRRSR